MGQAELVHVDLGVLPYGQARAIQEAAVERVRAAASEQAWLLLVEHLPPAITLGSGGSRDNILAGDPELRARGVDLIETDRGGDVTYHGPGQLVCYPIIRVDLHGRDLRRYVGDLEETVIRALGRLGITGARKNGARGVWVGGEKIASVGVTVRRWVAYHGFAVNVGEDLSGFDLIAPCGDPACRMTSAARVLARPVGVEELKGPLVECFAEVFGLRQVRRAAGSEVQAPQRARAARLPSWVSAPIRSGRAGRSVRSALTELGLQTVCSRARCPNLPECYARGTTTFLILGSVCTRACRFCAIRSGQPAPPRPDEPQAVAEAAARLRLRHVVITSVTRDDLPDGGACQFARTIEAVRARLPEAAVEVLTPDFAGSEAALDRVLDAGPDVFNHNVETVERLYPEVRLQASYARSLAVLRRAAGRSGKAARPVIKSGLMVGLGETDGEVGQVLRDLRSAGVQVVTIGQYLAPTRRHRPPARFVEPAGFEGWRREALGIGFLGASAGPLVRSSYRASEAFRGIDRAGATCSAMTGRGG